MGLKRQAGRYVVRWLTSKTRLALKRQRARLSRGRGDRVLHYFHRVDDPMCQLMVQVLPELAARFNVKLRPWVVERLDARFFPDPARFEALSILDANRLSALYGLGFPAEAVVPDRLAVGMATRHLLALEQDPSFFEAATAVGEALWRYDLKAVRSLAGMADMGDAHLRQNEARLKAMGHWSSGVVIYEGEVFQSLERLDLLEERLNAESRGDGDIQYNRHRDISEILEGDVSRLAGKTLTLFFSLRSPYSYLAFEQVFRLMARSGLDLELRPVLPMVTRGLPLPPLKRFFIIEDTAREARQLGIPFGFIDDPLGEPVAKAIAYGMSAAEEGLDQQFYRAWMQSTWAHGNAGASDKSFDNILLRAGLQGQRITPLETEIWQRRVDDNRLAMMAAGSWGVPTWMVDGQAFWGQDRLWAAVKALATPN